MPSKSRWGCFEFGSAELSLLLSSLPSCPRHGGKGGKGEYSNSMHLVGFGLLSHQPGQTSTEKGRISESSINAAYTVFIQS